MRRAADYIQYLGHTWLINPVPGAQTNWKKLHVPRLFLSCVSCGEPIRGSAVWVATKGNGQLNRHNIYTCTGCIPEN